MSNATTHTPARGRHAPAAELIAAAGLPDPVAQRIATIVRSTRLWKSEQSDIARELIAHAHDALAAGGTPEEIAKTLGDPANVAPLLRRSARRKRPWHWHARHRALEGVGVALLALIGVYAVLFIRFNTGSPEVKHDFIAELNERNSRYHADEKAAPAYESLAYAWEPLKDRLYEQARELDDGTDDWDRVAAIYRFPNAQSDLPGYDSFLLAYRTVLPEIEQAVAASSLPTLGIPYSDRHEEFTAEDGTVRRRVLPPTDGAAFDASVVKVLIPWFGYARDAARLIAFDAVLAAGNGDADRAARSLTAVFDTARLIGREHMLIASLVSMAIQALGEAVTLRLIHDHPGLLNESHLTAIAHAAGESGRISRDLDFGSERRMFHDFLQRAYTDDGRGDGRLTAEGIQLIRFYTDAAADATDAASRPATLGTRLAGPVMMASSASRAELRAVYDRMIAHLETSLRGSPSNPAFQDRHAEFEAFIQRIHEDPRHWVVLTAIPAFETAVYDAHESKAHTDATLTAIALHAHRHRIGRWPESLAELTPDLLPAVPEDPFDPGQPIKYRLIDGTPHLYFVGADGVDNHAARPPADNLRAVESLRHRYDPNPDDAPAVTGFDWVIFPPAD